MRGLAPRAAMAIVATMAAVACTDTPTVNPDPEAAKAELLLVTTGRARAALDPDGRFRLVQPASSPGEISERLATQYATAWVREYAPMVEKYLEDTHDAPINLRALSACGRTLYAQSGFDPPSSEIPLPYRRPYGPWWLVTFCEGESPTVSVAVSAWTTDLRFVDGKLEFPAISGGEFFGIGIPRGHQGEYPASPENAVRLAARQSNSTVPDVPELIFASSRHGPPQTARWRVPLSASRRFARRNGAIALREVYVGLPSLAKAGAAVLVSAEAQSDAVQIVWSPPPTIGERSDAYMQRRHAMTQVARIARRSNIPNRLEIARLTEDR